MRLFHNLKYRLGLTDYKFRIGDKVIYVNDFGVCWGVKTVIRLDERLGKPTYYFIPDQTPWFSVNEENLILASKADLKASLKELQTKYGFTPTEWYGCY